MMFLAFLYHGECHIKEKAKKLRSFHIFDHAIPWIECEVCKEMVIVAHEEVVALRHSSHLGVREETIIEDVTNLICNPRNSKGWWLREFELVTAEHAEDSDLKMFVQHPKLKDLDKYQVFLKARSYPSECESDCMTLAESCRRLMDGVEGDNLSAILYKFKKTRSEIVSTICGESCTRTADLIQHKMALLEKCSERSPQDSSKLVLLERDKCDIPLTSFTEEFIMKRIPARANSKELEIEEIMDNMDRKRNPNTPKMDVYDRDTVLEMQQAIMEGTKEDVAMFEPDIADLSDEEFAELQRVYREEKGDNTKMNNNDAADGLGSLPEDIDLSDPDIRAEYEKLLKNQ